MQKVNTSEPSCFLQILPLHKIEYRLKALFSVMVIKTICTSCKKKPPRNVWKKQCPPGTKFKRVAYIQWIIHSLVATTVPSLATIKQRGQTILSEDSLVYRPTGAKLSKGGNKRQMQRMLDKIQNFFLISSFELTIISSKINNIRQNFHLTRKKWTMAKEGGLNLLKAIAMKVLYIDTHQQFIKYRYINSALLPFPSMPSPLDLSITNLKVESIFLNDYRIYIYLVLHVGSSWEVDAHEYM